MFTYPLLGWKVWNGFSRLKDIEFGLIFCSAMNLWYAKWLKKKKERKKKLEILEGDSSRVFFWYLLQWMIFFREIMEYFWKFINLPFWVTFLLFTGVISLTFSPRRPFFIVFLEGTCLLGLIYAYIGLNSLRGFNPH